MTIAWGSWPGCSSGNEWRLHDAAGFFATVSQRHYVAVRVVHNLDLAAFRREVFALAKDRLPIIFRPGVCGGRATIQGSRFTLGDVFRERNTPYYVIRQNWPHIREQDWIDAVSIVNDVLWAQHEENVPDCTGDCPVKAPNHE